ncbi:MAG: TIGR02757 family protein [Alistipes sp.]
MEREELKELLELLHDKYNRPEFIEEDPISVPHRFTDRDDREIAGFFAATIAWGNRKAIVSSGHRMIQYMDHAPADFVRNASDRELAMLSSYVHRTFNGRDFRDFVLSIRSLYERFGGIGCFFESRYLATQDMRIVLSEFRREFLCTAHNNHCEKHLSSIDKGAACKRLNMYLRWMVRRDERGVDFGEWTQIPMSALYLPLDLHSGNVARSLGLLRRPQNDWKAVAEVTAALRIFDADDPVRYDFALFSAGIDRLLTAEKQSK